jgi:hypothetical protein
MAAKKTCYWRCAGMKVLLLHSADDLQNVSGKAWDLVIDLGRAPNATYQRWKQVAGCDVSSLHDLAQEIEDLYLARNLLQTGFGQVVDAYGVDWWDVILPELLPETLLLMLVERQARQLAPSCELYTTRPSFVAAAFAAKLGVTLRIVGRSRWKRSLQHYGRLLTHLDGSQFTQFLEEKFRIHRFASYLPPDSGPVVLLPSAYVNGSRMAVHLARQIPEHKFLLMYTRSSGRLSYVPANVNMKALRVDPITAGKPEILELFARWDALKGKITSEVKEFAFADSVGVFTKVPALLHNGVSLRDAWRHVFDSGNVTGLLCTDDSNPPTRIPLILAKARGLPTAVCHHGALDYFMAVKSPIADSYIAKSSLERDYLTRVCRLPAEKIFDSPSASAERLPWQTIRPANSDWLVFFSEPYGDKYWRTEEIYAELIPQLIALAGNLGLKLVFKIHPFESVKAHRRRLRRFAGDMATEVEVIAGPPDVELFQKTRIAITVQSTTGLECAKRGIPVFLCGWLRDAYSGYVAQFTRFGVGYALKSASQIADIPKFLELPPGRQIAGKDRQSADATHLGTLFAGSESPEIAIPC